MSRERVKKISDATEELLKRAKVDYRILDNEGCCGSVLLRTGFQEDALEIIKETFKNLKGKKFWFPVPVATGLLKKIILKF
jgi:Fe-S oxidoreductase